MKRFLGFAVAALVLPACGHTDHEFVVIVPAGGTLQFLDAAVQVDEDDVAGLVTLTVARTGGSAGDVSVTWTTTPGSAGAADFTGASGTLTWLAADAAPKTFTVNISSDALAEGSEFFSVTLSNATGGAVLGALTTATVEILDVADLPVSGSLQFSASTYPTGEGTTVSVVVIRTGGSTGGVSVEVDATGGTAAAPGDFTDPGFPVTLTWLAGDTAAKTVDILIADDAPGGDANVETILLALQNPLNLSGGPAPVLGTTQTAAVEITDGDAAGVMEFTSASFTIGENGTTGVLTVTRTGGTLGAASAVVSVTGGTAVGGGVDFDFPSPVTVSWADGVGGPQVVNVPVVDDLVNNGDVTVDFGLGTPVGAALGALTATTLSITDDEASPSAGEITFTAGGYVVAESAGTLILFVTRQNGTVGAVDVTVTTVAGTASSATNPAAKQDFVAVNQVLSWAAGVGGPQQVVITINNNDGTVGQTGDTFGGSETFTVNLSVTGGTAVIVGTNPVTVTINDD